MKSSIVLPTLFAGAAVFGVASASSPSQHEARKLTEKSADLKIGAQLSVGMHSPPANASAANPMTEGNSIPAHGDSSVGLGHPDVAHTCIIDTSASTCHEDGPCGSVFGRLDVIIELSSPPV